MLSNLKKISKEEFLNKTNKKYLENVINENRAHKEVIADRTYLNQLFNNLQQERISANRAPNSITELGENTNNNNNAIICYRVGAAIGNTVAEVVGIPRVELPIEEVYEVVNQQTIASGNQPSPLVNSIVSNIDNSVQLGRHNEAMQAAESQAQQKVAQASSVKEVNSLEDYIKAVFSLKGASYVVMGCIMATFFKGLPITSMAPTIYNVGQAAASNSSTYERTYSLFSMSTKATGESAKVMADGGILEKVVSFIGSIRGKK